MEPAYSQINTLAERLVEQLPVADKKKIIILDLVLPGGSPCPLGGWLADQISGSLARFHPQLDVIARAQWAFDPAAVEAHDENEENAFKEEYARSLGAQIVVWGNFAAVANGVGITLRASGWEAGETSHFEALGEISWTQEMQALLTSALPERTVTGGFYLASVAGISSPLCEYCPPPRYSYVSWAKKLRGVVILQVGVAPTGTVENVRVLRTPHPSLTNTAIRAVRAWRFKPATNAEGERVPVLVNVGVSFRLKTN
jgi:TonB family protein